MVSGAIYFLQGVFGGNGKKSTGGLKKKIVKEKPEVIPIKKEKPQKIKNVISFKGPVDSKKKRALADLNASFYKAYSANAELKKLAKEKGTDIERCQFQAINSQMKVVAKMLENLKK